MATATEALQGRGTLEHQISELELTLGRRVLIVSGVGDHPENLEAMPRGFASKNYDGEDTTDGGRLAAFASQLVGSSIFLALALTNPRVGDKGSGPHSEYREPGVILEDLMTSDPRGGEAFVDRRSTVHLVDSLNWIPVDSQVAQDETLGPPLKYQWHGSGKVAVLATVEVSFDDLEDSVRYDPDPAMAYPRQ